MRKFYVKSTCSGDSVYDIFENKKEISTLYVTLWVRTNKSNFQGKFVRIPYNDMPFDANYFKTKWLDSKTENIVLIKFVS